MEYLQNLLEKKTQELNETLKHNEKLQDFKKKFDNTQ